MPTNLQKPSPDDVLYLLRRKQDGALKLGITSNLNNRMSDYDSQYGGVTLLFVTRGSCDLERCIQAIFKPYQLPGKRDTGEWYAANAPILEYLTAHYKNRLNTASGVRCHLLSLMIARGLTEYEVVAATGIPATTIGKLSRNTWQSLEREAVACLCRYFGVGIAEMFSYESTTTPAQPPAERSA